ncbi:MAG: PorT family protein [Chitinophagaceae bacterium]|nr:MAG: PorT family protein [Chitinophagaceae bacterium]
MKRYFLLFASVALSTLVFGQVKPSFGVRGGVSYAGLQGDAVSSVQNLIDFSNGAITTSSRPRIFGGGFVNIPVGENFSIEPAVYYAQKGYELKGSFNIKGAEFLSAGAKAQLNTSYIDIPVLAKMNVSGLQIFAGPQVSVLTNAKLRMTAGALGFNIVDNTVDAKNQFNNLDFGVTGGLGYQFANGMSITAAYDQGLMKVDKGQNLDSYNRAVKVGLGFKF